MNKKIYIGLLSALLLLFLIAGFNSEIMAAEKEEVQSLINIAEKRYDDIKKSGEVKYAESEIQKIEAYINEAREDLKKGDEEMAYYKITICMSYFRKVEAQKELSEAQSDLDIIKEKLGK